MTAIVARPAHDELDGRLAHGIAALRLAIDGEGRTKLLRQLALLAKWNRVHNLTAVRDGQKAVSVHLLDSLAVTPYLGEGRVLDVGSGAGFPGIPVAIARPDLDVVLLDSNHKKSAFLREAVAELSLKNVTVVCERVESWHPAEKFDCIISRALTEIAEFVALTEHLLARGGVIAAMKGVHPFDEIEHLPSGFRVRQVHALSVPGLGAERHLVLIERT
jgi:16S rRNA (guanine527-N7)-methyltransferase